jgi:3-hydroxybutyryl-CoA dehydratase
MLHCGNIAAIIAAIIRGEHRMSVTAVREETPSVINGLHGFFFEDLQLGQSAVYGKTVTEADILMFSGVSGDINPLHLNQEFAEGTRFGGRIAHGMLTASLISTLIGTRLPGPGCIYVSQSLQFRAPVRPGDTVNCQATITALDPTKRKVTLDTVCTVRGTVVLKGEAVVIAPARDEA